MLLYLLTSMLIYFFRQSQIDDWGIGVIYVKVYTLVDICSTKSSIWLCIYSVRFSFVDPFVGPLDPL